MSVFTRVIVAVVVIWIILLVVHPVVDLAQTVLRTGQLLPFLLVMCSVLAVVAAYIMRPRWSMLRQLAEPPLYPCSTLLEKICIQRC
jgi:hypothetical protein